MLNTPYEVPEYPTVTQEDLNDLQVFLDKLNRKTKNHKYIITELYTDETGTLPLQTYEVYNLNIEYDKGILIASDRDEVLWNEKHYFHSIPIDHITYMTFNSIKNFVTLTIGNDDTYGLIVRIFY